MGEALPLRFIVQRPYFNNRKGLLMPCLQMVFGSRGGNKLGKPALPGTIWPSRGSCKPAAADWLQSLKGADRKVFSQNGEDGILLLILANIGWSSNPYYVEVNMGVYRGTCSEHGDLM
jgi:hypothetical protein